MTTSVRGESPVRGGLTLESQGACLALHVIAHQGELDLEKDLPDYAMGDVEWLAWYQDSGYGRAAGSYEDSTWSALAYVQLNL